MMHVKQPEERYSFNDLKKNLYKRNVEEKKIHAAGKFPTPNNFINGSQKL